MTSKLSVAPVEDLKSKATETVKGFGSRPGVFISLNRTQKSSEDMLRRGGAETRNIFFIDCMSTENTRPDVLHLHPTQMEEIAQAVGSFMKEIEGEKFIVIDALSIFLIYNGEAKLKKFVGEMAEHGKKPGVDFVAITPETRDEDVLADLADFFDVKEK